mmetsp:Transcript_122591/g.392358  ORF Transcript_122591/g.392358 Transcript_122591/m.392358 type:complete len:258 (+) Transcript_122591:603-1376(+)
MVVLRLARSSFGSRPCASCSSGLAFSSLPEPEPTWCPATPNSPSSGEPSLLLEARRPPVDNRLRLARFAWAGESSDVRLFSRWLCEGVSSTSSSSPSRSSNRFLDRERDVLLEPCVVVDFKRFLLRGLAVMSSSPSLSFESSSVSSSDARTRSTPPVRRRFSPSPSSPSSSSSSSTPARGTSSSNASGGWTSSRADLSRACCTLLRQVSNLNLFATTSSLDWSLRALECSSKPTCCFSSFIDQNFSNADCALRLATA